MPRKKNGPVFMAALGCAVLGLAACDGADWVGRAIKSGQGSGAPSGSSGGTSAGGGTGGQPSSPPPPACVTKSSGGSSSCQPDATWKQYASDDCAATGATLTGSSPDEACGDGNSRSVKYTCCVQAPPSPAPPGQCTTKSQSIPACQPDETWKQYASDDCAATAATLTGYSPSEECGAGNSRSLKYTCCVQAPTPPAPPGQCTTKSQSIPACQPDETWKQYASDDCAAAGATLTGYSPSEECGAGNSRSLKYTCCGPTSPPPVSPPAK